MKRLDRKSLKIISAVSVTIFSLLVLTMGVFAWFSSAIITSKQAEEFEVTTVGDCTLATVKLYKFIYPDSAVTDGYDYLRPEDGTVNKYDYNEEQQHFGYYDTNNNWVSVSAMNVFDPIELIISRDKTLKDMNCNVIYEVKFSSTIAHPVMDLISKLRTDVVVTTNEMLLSDCVDFDVYFPSDLSDTNPLFLNSQTGQYDKYYPSYKNNLSSTEKDYYKISYLSSLVGENNHVNFYSTNPKANEITLKHTNLTLDSQGYCTLYINANYAPKKLMHLAKVLYLHDIEAIYDFSFEINLAEANS